jgi:excisionase family DNA binding protein
MNATVQNTPEPLWTAGDVKGFLRCSLSMVYKLVREGKLPAIRVGTLLRFNPDQVRAFARGDLGAGAPIVPLTRSR